MDIEEELRAILRAYWKGVQRDEANESFGWKMGVTNSQVSQIKSGKRNVTVEHIALLAKVQDKSLALVLAELQEIASREQRRRIETIELPEGDIIVAPSATRAARERDPASATRPRPARRRRKQ